MAWSYGCGGNRQPFGLTTSNGTAFLQVSHQRTGCRYRSRRLSLPDGLRFARPGDEARLWDFCRIAHADNGLVSVSPGKVQALLARICNYNDPPGIIALVDGPERIEAAICLDSTQHWYSEDWFWCDRFLYVDPRHRHQGHASKLLTFAVWWEETVARPGGAAVVISIETLHRLPAKERLFSRYARRFGGSFLIGKLPVEEVGPQRS